MYGIFSSSVQRTEIIFAKVLNSAWQAQNPLWKKPQCKSDYFESTALNQCWFSVLFFFFQQVESTLIRCLFNVECPLVQSVNIILCVLLQSTLFTTSVILICTHQRWVYQGWISKQHINTPLEPPRGVQFSDVKSRSTSWWNHQPADGSRFAGSQSVSLKILRSHRIIFQAYWGSENIQMQTAFSFVMLASHRTCGELV